MGPGDEIIVLGDLEGSCNMTISIWSDEEKTYKLTLKVIVPQDLGWNDSPNGTRGYL